MGRKITTVVCVLVIVATAVLLLANCFGVRNYTMESGSMAPSIKEGTLCFINENTPYDKIQEGDVIAFETTDVLGEKITLIARVQEITEEGFTTKGDANEFSDGETAKEGYIGKSVLSIPFIGKVVDVLRNLAARIVVYVCLIVLLVIVLITGKDEEDYEESPEESPRDEESPHDEESQGADSEEEARWADSEEDYEDDE